MKAIGYIRVSTSSQDTQRQKDKIEAYCLKNGIELIRYIEDFGVSGKSNERQGYSELMQLSSKDCDYIIISEISRLSRQEEVTETANDVQHILKSGISVVIIDGNIKEIKANEPIDLPNLLFLIIELWSAAKERQEIKRRMFDGKRTKFKLGNHRFHGSTVPYGFKVTSDSELIINESEAQNVRDLYGMCANGSTLRQLSEYTIKHGIKFRKKGYASASAIRQLLSNPLYKGVVIRHFGKETDIKEIIPIVDAGLWQIVQDKFKSNTQNVTWGKKGYQNDFKGILRCCNCNHSMIIVSRGDFKYYRCGTLNLAKSDNNRCKDGCQLGVDTFNQLIEARFNGQTAEYYESVKTEWKSRILAEIKAIRERIEGFKSEKEDIQVKRKRAVNKRVELMIDSEIDDVQSDVLQGLDEKIRGLKTQIEAKEAQIKDYTSQLKELEVALNQTSVTIDNKVEFYRATIERIRIFKIRTKYKYMVIEYKSFEPDTVIVFNTSNQSLRAVELIADFNIEVKDDKLIVGQEEDEIETEYGITPVKFDGTEIDVKDLLYNLETKSEYQSYFKRLI